MTSYQYRKSHCGDKTILRPSYLHNGISYTGKTTFLCWIWALVYSLYSHFRGRGSAGTTFAGPSRLCSWWHHDMETLSTSLAICAGNPCHWWIPLIKGQWCLPLVISFLLAWTSFYTKTVEVVWDAVWHHCNVILQLHKKLMIYPSPEVVDILMTCITELHCMMNHYVAMGMEPQVVICINSVPWYLVRFHWITSCDQRKGIQNS